MHRRPLLIEIFDTKKAFYGGHSKKNYSVLKKPAGQATSDGVRRIGIGIPRHPAFLNQRRWTNEPLRTEPKAPTNLNNLKQPIPLKKKRRLLADIELVRTRLIIESG